MTRKLTALAILLLAAVACTPPIVVTPPQERIQVGFYSVAPQIEWNRAMYTADEVWTVDGYGLQMLRFFQVPDGQQLFPEYSMFGPKEPDQNTPIFRSTMTPNEIQEFIVETLAGDGWANIKTAALAPAKFGSLPGFRFAFSMVDDDGLEFDGMTIGVVREDTLHFIVYSGTRLHYFPKYRKDVDKLFASIRT